MLLRSVVVVVVCSVFTSLISRGSCQTGVPCPSVIGKPSCVCNHPDGKGTIDASSFGKTGIDAPRFKGLVDPEGYSYTYNPCHPYHESLCDNVHSCQTSNFNPEITYTIASGGTEEMYIDSDGTPYIFYTGPGGRTIYVYLHCTDSSSVQMTTEGDSNHFYHYVFHLHSCHVCPGGGRCGAAVAAGVVGILLIVFLLIGIGIYIVMGIVVMRVKYNATGLGLIPNRAFWMSFPGLLKDGFLFTLSPCLKLRKNNEYSEIKS